jgi:hypothetical protein
MGKQEKSTSGGQSDMIQVLNAIYGGERFTKSEDGKSIIDNGADKTGFKLGADGKLIASNAEISGTVNANFGSFDNISIGNNAFFSGIINSGPLYASNENTSEISGNIYNSNTSVRLVWESLSGADGIPYPGSGQTFAVVSGTYGDKSGLLTLVFYHGAELNPVTGLTVETYSLKLNFADGTSININSGYGRYNPPLGATLELGGGQPGKTLKFNDLPVGDGGLQPGAVYMTSDGTLKVKI